MPGDMGDTIPGGIVAAASKCSHTKWYISVQSRMTFWIFNPVCVCVPENRLQVVKGLEDVEVSECESCSFEVTLNLAFIEGVWSRDDMQLKSKPNWRISTHGKKHSLVLSRVALGDAGFFSFEANGVQTAGRLSVTGEEVQ